MAQFTAKTPHLALIWILTNPHHEVGTEYRWTIDLETGQGEIHHKQIATHTFFRNHHDKLRVPVGMKGFHSKIKPNPRPHDDRMFTVTKHGRRWLREQGFIWNHREHP